jgi:hypothetical protein
LHHFFVTLHHVVHEWLKRTRRPAFLNAARIARLTGGEVPIEAWGYTPEEMDAVRGALADDAARAASQSPDPRAA